MVTITTNNRYIPSKLQSRPHRLLTTRQEELPNKSNLKTSNHVFRSRCQRNGKGHRRRGILETDQEFLELPMSVDSSLSYHIGKLPHDRIHIQTNLRQTTLTTTTRCQGHSEDSQEGTQCRTSEWESNQLQAMSQIAGHLILMNTSYLQRRGHDFL